MALKNNESIPSLILTKFETQGGADQNYPVIVSRVASGSPADKANPRLNEGDQVGIMETR